MGWPPPLSVIGCGGSSPSKGEIAQERADLTRILSAEVMKSERGRARATETACRSQVGRALTLLENQPQALTHPRSCSLPRLRTTARASTRSQRRWVGSPGGRSVGSASRSIACLEQQRLFTRVSSRTGRTASTSRARGAAASSFCAPQTIRPRTYARRRITLRTRTSSPGTSCVSPRRSCAPIGTLRTRSSVPRRGSWSRWVRQRGRARRSPRSEREVGSSVIGKAVRSLCAGDSVPSDAVRPCQDLRDLMIQGVAIDEDSDLNKALSGLVDAYQLRPSG